MKNVQTWKLSRARRLPFSAWRPVSLFPVLGLALVCAAACGDGDGGVDPAPNRAPEARGSIPARTLAAGQTATVDASVFFSDPDGDVLSYGAESSDASVAAATIAGSVVTVAGVAAGTASVTVTAADPGGLSASLGVAVTVVEEGANRAPEAVGTIPAQTLAAGQTATVDASVFFSDPDGDVLSYGAESSDASVAAATIAGSVVTVAGVAAGTASVTVTAADPGGLSASLGVAVTVVEEGTNRAPDAVGTIPAQTLAAGQTATVDASVFFSDPDGDVLSYGAESSDAAVAAATIAGSVVTVAGVAAGTAAVTVTASDPGGLSASLDVAVTVAGESINRAPEAIGTIPDLMLAANTSMIAASNVTALFHDPDEGERLTYGVESSDTGTVRASIKSGGNVLVVRGTGRGTAAVTATATDFFGLSASLSFEVIVTRNPGPTPMCDRTPELIAAIFNLSNPSEECKRIPADAGRAIRNLFLQEKGIPSLKAGDFSGMPLLRDIVLDSNRIASIEDGAFRGLTLRWLGLKDNMIGELRPGMFADMTVRVFHLSRNRFTELPAGVFSLMRNLGVNDRGAVNFYSPYTVYISGGMLERISDGVFSDMNNLELLALVNTRITEIRKGMFRNPNLSRLILGYPDGDDNLWEMIHGDPPGSGNISFVEAGAFNKNELPRLHVLHMNWQQLEELTPGIFEDLAGHPNPEFGGTMWVLNLEDNPGSPFTFEVGLVRTDNPDAAAPGPATVALSIVEGAPYSMSVDLIVRGGSLSSGTASIEIGETRGSEVEVSLAAGSSVAVVVAGTPPPIPSGITSYYYGIEVAKGEPLVLFGSGGGRP